MQKESTGAFVQELKVSYARKRRFKNSIALTQPEPAAEFARRVLPQDREGFIGIYLDIRNHPIGWQLISVGTLSESLVHPREVFKPALLSNAAHIIVCHNHPSGDPSPSENDLTLTTRLCQAGKLLGIPVLDHLVIGDRGKFVSLQERGLMR